MDRPFAQSRRGLFQLVASAVAIASLSGRGAPAQEGQGRVPSPMRGKTPLDKDGHAGEFIDLKSGIRFQVTPLDLGDLPRPLPRVPLQRRGRVSTERYGFTGH